MNSNMESPPLELRWTPFFVLLKKEVHRFMKVLTQTVVTPFISSSLYLLIFGVSLGAYISITGAPSYLAFLIPGLVMMGCLNNAFQNTSSSIVGSKFGGDLEDLKVAPLSVFQIIWAMSLAGVLRGLIVGGITMLIGQLFYLNIHGGWLAIENPLTALFFLVVGGLTFSQLGISVAFWAKTFDQLSAVGGFILLPLIYLGGVFFSLNNLHPFWQSVSKFNPMLYFINGFRHGILGNGDVSLNLCIAFSLLALLVCYGIAERSLRSSSFMRW